MQLADGGQSVTISGVNDGSVTGGPSFTDFAHLVGGSGDDTFTLSGGSFISTDGGAGINTLVGSDSAETFTITGNTNGIINGSTFSGITVFNGNDGNDQFVIDFASIGLLDVTIAGASGSDSLLMQNGSHTDVTYSFSGSDLAGNNGEIRLDSHSISFSGLDPIVNTGSASNIVINLPDVSVNTVSLENDATRVGNTQLIGSTLSNTSFSNPLASLTVNLGDMGDALTLASVDAGFDARLIVNGGASTDNLTQTGDLGVLNGITFVTENIHLNHSSLSTSGEAILLQGTVTLGDPAVTIDSAGGDIQFASTIDGTGNDLVLNAGSLGNITVAGQLANVGDMTVIDGATQTYQTMALDSLDIQDGTTVTLGGNVVSAGLVSVKGGNINLSGSVDSDSGDIRIAAADGVNQHATITANDGTVSVFADSGSIVMDQGVTTRTAGQNIVYTSNGDAVIAILDTGQSSSTNPVITVTSVEGDVRVAVDSSGNADNANIMGAGALANVYALGDTGSIGGETSHPFRFQQSDETQTGVSAINTEHDRTQQLFVRIIN